MSSFEKCLFKSSAHFLIGLLLLSCMSCLYILEIKPLEYCLKSGMIMPPALFFFLRIAFAILGLLWFHINFRIICSTSTKNTIDNLIGITLNQCIALGSMVILTILILPVQEHGISFHFFDSSSIFFVNVL